MMQAEHKPRTEAMLALGMIENMLTEASTVKEHAASAEVDLRAISDIKARLEANPRDPSSIQWLKQVAQTWSPKLRQHAIRFRRVYDYLAVAGK